jgi:predicted lipoprotein with Yx(FWY)xxD motif
VTASAAAAPTTISSATPGKLGRILVSAHGNTLYMFTKDSSRGSSCNGGCASSWRPVLAGRVAAGSGSGLSARLLGTVKRSNGFLQAAYNHHPLYTFSGDRSAGSISGEGADEFGGHWYAVDVAGNEVQPKHSTSQCHPVCSGY